MKKIFMVITVMLFALVVSSSKAETGQAGQAGAFFKFGLGARSLGMGGAYAGVAEGIDAIYYNPGGLAFSRIKEFGFTYHSLTLDRHLNSAYFVLPARNEAVIALSWINSYVSDVQMRDSDRNLFGDFSNSNNSFGLSFSKLLGESASLGANLRYLQTTLDLINSYTVGVDLGALYKPGPNYAVGLAVSDLGSSLNWSSTNYWSGNRGSEYSDKFPVRVRGGVAGKFMNDQLIAAVDLVKIEKLDFKIYSGAEYWFFKKITREIEDEEAEDELREIQINKRLLGLRGGYSDGSLTFGMSLYYPYGKLNGGIDYAYLTGRRDEGSNHIFTIRVLF
jgi:hypothetical protein